MYEITSFDAKLVTNYSRSTKNALCNELNSCKWYLVKATTPCLAAVYPACSILEIGIGLKPATDAMFIIRPPLPPYENEFVLKMIKIFKRCDF